MAKALEAIETGVMVLDYVGKGVAVMLFVSMGTAVFLAVQLIKARHILAAHGLL